MKPTAVHLRLLVIGLVTIGCLVAALWRIDRDAARSAVAAFHASVLPLVLLLFAASFLSRVARFRLLIDRRLPWREVLPITSVGFLAINVVPLRMGELVRPYLLREVSGLPFGAGMAAVVLERLFDMVALLLFMLVAVALVPVPAGAIQVLGIDLLEVGRTTLVTSLVLGLVGVFGLAVAGPAGVKWTEAAANRISPRLGGIVGRLGGQFVHGLRSLGARPIDALSSAVLTFVLWGTTAVSYGVMMAGFELEASPSTALLNFVATMLAMLVGPTPGFFGSFEAGSVASLVYLGADPGRAGAYAIVNHLVGYALTAAMGVVMLFVQGWSLRNLVRESQRAGD